MPGDLPSVAANRVALALESFGFECKRRTGGSHCVYKKEGHRLLVTVPDHGNRPIACGTLRNIIRASGIAKEDFVQRLTEV